MSETSTLLEALRAHYIGPETFPGGVFLSEVQIPQVHGATVPNGRVRRADAVYLGFTQSRGWSIDVHELKVSTSDFRAELASPVKAEAWWRYSTRFWVVSPGPHITPPADLPDGWGLMCPKSRGRRFQVLMRPAEREPQVDLALLIEIAKKLDTMRAEAVSAAREEARRQGAARLDELWAKQRETSILPADQRRLDAVARLEKAAGFDLDVFAGRAPMWARSNNWSATPEQFDEALRLAMQIVKGRDKAAFDMAEMARRLTKVQGSVQQAIAHVADAQAAYEALVGQADEATP